MGTQTEVDSNIRFTVFPVSVFLPQETIVLFVSAFVCCVLIIFYSKSQKLQVMLQRVSVSAAHPSETQGTTSRMS